MIFQGAQVGRRHGLAVERRTARNGVEKSGTETVNVTAKILRLIVQPFRRNVIRCAPNRAAGLRRGLGNSGESEIADLSHPILVI